LTPQQSQFLSRVTPAAMASERLYGIPACVTIAQAILESATPKLGWGSSVLFRVANNPFGIKYCHFGSGDRVIGRSGEQADRITPSGDRVSSAQNLPSSAPPQGSTLPMTPATEGVGHPVTPSPDRPVLQDYGHFDVETWEVENGQKKVVLAEFQRFPDLNAAFAAHAWLLRGPRYRPAFDVQDDWKQFAERLGPPSSPHDGEHCGYSTSPSYSAQLIQLVNLYRLNDPRALEWFATGQDPEPRRQGQVSGIRDQGPGVRVPARIA
jgi:hypothetical protein